jgi:hypothetical protein
MTIDGIIDNLASAAIVVGLAFIWFQLGSRKEEKRWIKTNGLLFYIYFRNVDWRCEEIRKTLSNPSDRLLDDLNRELRKLRNDVDCLDRITELWSDRVAAFPTWYPYSKRVQNLLTASSLLALSLVRHIDPLLWHISEEIPEDIQCNEHTIKDRNAYQAYFLGGDERIWAGKTAKGTSVEAEMISELQGAGRLHKRLEELLILVRKLLKEDADVKMEESGMRDSLNWPKAGPHHQVWYRPDSYTCIT